MGDYVVNLVIHSFKIVRTVFHFFCVWHFLTPPTYTFVTHFCIVTFSSAHTKEGLTAKCEYLTPHKVVDVLRYLVSVAALVPVWSVRIEHIKIFVCTIYKADGVLLFCQLFYVLFFFIGAVPKKAEVSAYD